MGPHFGHDLARCAARGGARTPARHDSQQRTARAARKVGSRHRGRRGARHPTAKRAREARLPPVRRRARRVRALDAPGLCRGAPSAEHTARGGGPDPLQQSEVSERRRA